MAFAVPHLRRAMLGAALILFVGCGSGQPEVGPGGPVGASETPDSPESMQAHGSTDKKNSTGARIFQASCAPCHGELGDGAGAVVFDKPARSFVDGGFSFGNTPDALFRTVSSGIGGTPMPGFKDTLSDDEIRAVVRHVISLGPERVVVAPDSTVMTVTDKPLVVRGSFPPLREGDKMTPRGLLVGGLDGLSFQYDLDTMNLIAVRQGGFVDRRDWENRGGDTLEPLGEVVFVPGDVLGEKNKALVLDWESEASATDLGPPRLELKATEIRGDRALVEYDIYIGPKRIASIQEHPEALSLGGWTGFRREFEVKSDAVAAITTWLAGGDAFDEIPALAGEDRIVRLATNEHGFGTIWISRGQPKVIRTSLSSDQTPAIWTHDFLFGLKPTDANLAALKEAL